MVMSLYSSKRVKQIYAASKGFRDHFSSRGASGSTTDIDVP